MTEDPGRPRRQKFLPLVPFPEDSILQCSRFGRYLIAPKSWIIVNTLESFPNFNQLEDPVFFNIFFAFLGFLPCQCLTIGQEAHGRKWQIFDRVARASLESHTLDVTHRTITNGIIMSSGFPFRIYFRETFDTVVGIVTGIPLRWKIPSLPPFY